MSSLIFDGISLNSATDLLRSADRHKNLAHHWWDFENYDDYTNISYKHVMFIVQEQKKTITNNHDDNNLYLLLSK
jgi:hypothetical protein